jgi:WD40 repeat protein/subtilisin-like proprotein convertase family protein
MPSVMQPAEFFVVGGPVQPERLCYVERAADRKLEAALRAKRLCCVLGPPGVGKSSLLHRAARGLRAGGALVAVVDLRGIAEQGGAARDTCLRLVAERIAAELKLGVDVEAWWSDCDSIDESRFVRFCSELVLTQAMAPIVVLLDDIDAALASEFGADLLTAIGNWCSRRAREPGFGRLRFALAGRASLRELAQASPDFPAAEAELVEPEDFTAEESYRLAVAFGDDQELAQALMDRIRAWTHGHPYLTQRIARGVARKDGRFEDVERVVREQVLAADAAARDPLLAHLRAWLTEPSRPARRAAKLLQQLADGAKVAEPTDVAVAERLRLSGTVRTDAERRIHVRNRIFKELVHAGWLKKRSGAPKWLAAAAVLLVAATAGGYWYTQRLPVADVATLTEPTVSLREAEQSYRRLRGLPGFEQRADELWTDALGRSSRAAATLADAVAADTRLRELPGQAAAADRLLSEFWLRRARERAHAEERGAAILLAQRAAALPAADPAAAAYLAELAGDDYSRLERSSRLASQPEYWRMAFAGGAFLAIDAERRVSRTPFGAAAEAGALGAEPSVLTALAHSALTRELTVDGEGTAGELELSLAVQHAAAGDLLVTLTAPGGAAADVRLPLSDGAAVETFVFQAAEGSPLAQLADEGLRGTWRLTVVDRELANTGFFGSWGLRFGDTVVRDDLAELVAIPDPMRSSDVIVQAAGERAIARPISPSVVGTLAVWNLASGLLEHDLTLPEPPRAVALDPTGSRVLASTDRALMLWNADGELVARVGTETEFVLPPVFSADGGYVAIAERVEGGNPLYSVLRTEDGSHVSSIEGAQDVQAWELGPGGRYVALQGPETVVRVIETQRGAELRRLAHTDAVERILHSSDGAMLVTIDRAGAITSWPLALASAELGRPLGRTVAAATVSSSADGRRIAFARDDGAVAVLDTVARAELYRLRLERSIPVTRTQLSADGMELVTQSGVQIKAWRLPSKPVTPRTTTGETMATAVALHRGDDVLAAGFASGQLEIAPVGAAGPRSPLSFFGHRGPVTAVALNGSRGLAVTGGNDGIVRLWDLAASAPTGAVAQPAELPVALVALSEDGRYVASAAERTVRVAAVADGRVTAELQTGGAVTALVFEPGSARLAVGDASGAVVIAAPVAGAGRRVTARLAAAVTALSFTPAGGRLAAADAAGAIVLVNAESGAAEGTVHRWLQPIRWLEFSPDGTALLVATDSWLHALAATPALTPSLSKLAVWPAASTAFSAVSASAVRFAGVEGGGFLVSGDFDLAVPPSPVTADASALVARDWSAALALALNDNGDPVARAP